MAERAVARQFIADGAVSMADAVPYTSVRASHQRAFARLKGLDIIRTDGQGRWWLDEAGWRDRQSRNRTRAVLAVLALGVAPAFTALR